MSDLSVKGFTVASTVAQTEVRVQPAQDVVTPPEAPAEPKSANYADAASVVEISRTPPPPAPTQPKDSQVTYEQVRQLAVNLSETVRNIRPTKVSFQTDSDSSGPASLRFQVIDSTSGKVVREFPPEIAETLSHQTDRLKGKEYLLKE